MDTIRQFEGAMADGGPAAVARALVEACVNEVMSARADAMCEETGTSRNGFRERGLETQVGAITLRIPKLREGTCFPEGIVERRGRVDRAVICAASEMFAPSVSTRKVGKVLEKMGAARLSEDRVSRICFELDAEVSELRGRDLSGRRFPYPWVDAAYVPCRRGGHGAAAAVAAAVAVGEDGIRRMVGLACVDTEPYASWKGFLRGLRERGLEGVRCVTSDAHGGIVRAVREVFPGAAWQRCVVHLERDVVSAIPTRAGRVLHAIFAEEDPARARAMYQAACGLISRLSRDAAAVMESAEADALAHLDFPAGHRRRIRTNNVQERLNREIKRRSRVVQSFPSEASLVRLVGAVRCEEWSSRRYMEPSGIEALWERSAAPLPDPEAGQVDRARSRIIALAGLDWMEEAA